MRACWGAAMSFNGRPLVRCCQVDVGIVALVPDITQRLERQRLTAGGMHVFLSVGVDIKGLQSRKEVMKNKDEDD